jgi:tetratricopeptide (TPR) repeat protein
MPGVHLSREFIEGLLEGRQSPAELAPLVVGHLHSACPPCREALEAYRRLLDETRLHGAYPELGGAERHRGSGESVAGPEPCRPGADLTAVLPRAERLLREARAQLPDRPAEALVRARAAEQVLWERPGGPAWAEAYARALAHEGDAQRALGDLEAAEDALSTSRFFLRSSGGGSRATTAEVDEQEALLRRAQRRFPESTSLLRRAAVTYQMARDPVAAARSLLTLSAVHREAGELPDALAAAEEALALISAERDPQLSVHAQYALAQLLLEAGDLAEARRMLEACRPLLERVADSLTQLRALWFEGKLARAEGDGEAAESALRASRDGFARRGIGYDAALVSLDLAAVLLGNGRSAEVKALAEEMLPLFQAEDVHREAAAALVQFIEAARAGDVTLAFISELAAYLQAARHDRSLAFRPPS